MRTSKSKIPVFVLAGGLGTRLSEETHLKPKPMIEIGGEPILLHVMRWYYSFGFDDFVICAGYRSWEIKNYFLTYEFRRNHFVIDHRKGPNTPPAALGRSLEQERWRVRILDTGLDTGTGGRVARAFDAVNATEPISAFALTYGDGLCNVDLDKELNFHLTHGRVGTVLGVRPLARFGELDAGADGIIRNFVEKPQSRQGTINGGFFFLNNEFRRYLTRDTGCVLEKTPLATLAEDGQLVLYFHDGFWHPMDTLRDKVHLQALWDSGRPPWIPPHPERV